MTQFSKIENVLDSIKTLFKFNRKPVQPLPLPLVLVGSPNRSGLSAIDIANRIIARKGEAGLPVGPLPNGEQNPEEIMIRIIVEEVIRAIHEDSVVTVAVPPGNTLTAAGANSGGPIVVTGSTTSLHRAYGVIQ
jgi:hypothetical protein